MPNVFCHYVTVADLGG